MNPTFMSEVWHRLVSQHVRRTNAMQEQDLHCPASEDAKDATMIQWFRESRTFQCAALALYLSKFFALHFPLQVSSGVWCLLFHALPSSCSHRVVLLISFDYPLFWRVVLKTLQCLLWRCTFYWFCISFIFAYIQRCPQFQFTVLRSCISQMKTEASCGVTLGNCAE